VRPGAGPGSASPAEQGDREGSGRSNTRVHALWACIAAHLLLARTMMAIFRPKGLLEDDVLVARDEGLETGFSAPSKRSLSRGNSNISVAICSAVNPSRALSTVFMGRLLKLASSLQHNCPFLHRGAGQLASDERVDRSVARSLGERGFT
jgi:hypothetical protein